MNTSVLGYPSPVAAHYWVELQGLSNSVKLELITLLSSSMTQPTPAKSNPETGWADRFCGAWKDHRSAEEIVVDIRSMRTENHFEAEL